jgi:hypothetical protein
MATYDLCQYYSLNWHYPLSSIKIGRGKLMRELVSDCWTCSGHGTTGHFTSSCDGCKGKGTIQTIFFLPSVRSKCSRCGGTGKVHSLNRCDTCSGTGKITTAILNIPGIGDCEVHYYGPSNPRVFVVWNPKPTDEVYDVGLSPPDQIEFTTLEANRWRKIPNALAEAWIRRRLEHNQLLPITNIKGSGLRTSDPIFVKFTRVGGKFPSRTQVDLLLSELRNFR